VTVSVGIATHAERDTVARLVARADEALYQAKAQGRNRVVVASADAAAPADDHP
jgi:diguanylate cyclase (GGDEF)-like protein